MVTLFYNHKGGVGKTTLCSHVAFMAKEKNHNLTILDYDKQHNTMEYLLNHKWNLDDTVNSGSIVITTDLKEASSANNLIIDVPPAYDMITELSKHFNIDYVVVPIIGRFSIAGASRIIEDITSQKSSVKIILVSNMTEETTNSKMERKEMQKLIDCSGNVEIYDLPIPQSSVFRKAETFGLPAWKVPYGVRSTATQNIQVFSEWLLRKMIYGS